MCMKQNIKKVKKKNLKQIGFELLIKAFGPFQPTIIKITVVMLPGSALTGKVVDEKFIQDNRELTRKPFEFYKEDIPVRIIQLLIIINPTMNDLIGY